MKFGEKNQIMPLMPYQNRFAKLRTIQNESGGEAALKTLMLGGHLSFNDRFWNDIESEQSARTESNNKASYLKMAQDIISSTTSDRDATDVDSIVKI